MKNYLINFPAFRKIVKEAITSIFPERVWGDIGMSLFTAINIYLKKLGREKRIPFEVAVDPFYSQENMARLKESVAQMEATGGTVHKADFDD